MKKTRKIIEKEIERGKKQIGWAKLSLWLKGGIIGIIVGCIIAIIMGLWWLILFFGIGALIGWIIEQSDKREKERNKKKKNKQ